MSEPVVIFRTQSGVEASIVRGLLESHGVMALLSSAVAHSVFPLNVNELGEVRISVRPEEAEEARRIIESHRTALETGKVVRLRDEFDSLQQAIDYRFRDRGLLEHAMTHTSRANEDVSGGVIDNESLEFLGDAILGFIIADILFHALSRVQRRAEVEGQGDARLDGDAGAAGRAAGARRSPAARARRGEDRRPPQAGAARRRLRGADRRDLPGRRRRAGARVHQPRVRDRSISEVHQAGVAGGDHKSALQEYLQSNDEALPEYRLAGTVGPDHRKLFQIQVVVRDQVLAEAIGPSKKEAEQEAARRRAGEAARQRLGEVGIRNS